MRTLISAALVLMLVLTSQAMAVARGSADATGQIVICVGAGTQTLYTDAQGDPTQAPHFCPECALHLALVTERSGVLRLCGYSSADIRDTSTALCVPTARGLIPQTRAPPSVV